MNTQELAGHLLTKTPQEAALVVESVFDYIRIDGSPAQALAIRTEVEQLMSIDMSVACSPPSKVPPPPPLPIVE